VKPRRFWKQNRADFGTLIVATRLSATDCRHLISDNWIT
jgi:hypothetical protein